MIQKDPKLGTIILHGVPSSGKSSLINIMREIFITSVHRETQGNFDMVPKLRDYKFQLVVCEETKFIKLLSDSHIDNTKMFFERNGRPLEAKGKDAVWLY